MKAPRRPRVVYVSTYPPRRCGLATFTRDLVEAGDATGLLGPSAVVAIGEVPGEYAYDPHVVLEVIQDRRADYAAVAADINRLDADVVNLQHEFGIFGGEDGAFVLDLIENLRRPLVTTLHTVLSRPDARKVRIIRRVAERSQVIVVMARRAVDLLSGVYGIPAEKVVLIPHGAPAAPAEPRGDIRRRLGLGGRFVLCTLGLINPGKGIEYALEALPEVVADHPEVLYLVLGQTHPGVKRHMGEAYRDHLLGLVERLGLGRHVRFVDAYLSQRDLVAYLAASDVYLTPYLGRDQITSGTLAYAVALGKAIVSTPYVYAEEMLAGGAGILVPFRDPRAIAAALRTLITRPRLRGRLEGRTAARGWSLSWSKVAHQYARLFLETGDAEGRPRTRLQRSGPRRAAAAYTLRPAGGLGGRG